MSKSEKHQKLKPQTIKKGIAGAKIKIKWLQKRAEKIRVQIGRLEGTIRDYQDRCPHPDKKLDNEGLYRFCTTCGASFSGLQKGQIIPPEQLDYDYDEDLYK